MNELAHQFIGAYMDPASVLLWLDWILWTMFQLFGVLFFFQKEQISVIAQSRIVDEMVRSSSSLVQAAEQIHHQLFGFAILYGGRPRLVLLTGASLQLFGHRARSKLPRMVTEEWNPSSRPPGMLRLRICDSSRGVLAGSTGGVVVGIPRRRKSPPNGLVQRLDPPFLLFHPSVQVKAEKEMNLKPDILCRIGVLLQQLRLLVGSWIGRSESAVHCTLGPCVGKVMWYIHR